jgi:hypothetical protein
VSTPALEDAIARHEQYYCDRATCTREFCRDGHAIIAAARAHLTDSLDARRYRWLRNHSDTWPEYPTLTVVLQESPHLKSVGLLYEALDARVDAALAATQGAGKI